MRYKITSKDQDRRLDQIIKEYLDKNNSLKKIKTAIENGNCQINKSIDFRPNYKCQKGDVIQYQKSGRTVAADNSAYSVLWEDKYFIAKNKAINTDSLDDKLSDKGQLFLAHRLDKATSGVLLFAKSQIQLDKIQTLFKRQLIKKTYHALVQGSWKLDEGTIQTQHGSKGKQRGLKIWGSLVDGGQEAITHYRIIAKNEAFSYVEFKPQTGRTHQLRVHAADGGHPILGDRLYGKALLTHSPRLMLHASQLEFRHPVTLKIICIESKLPQDFLNFLKAEKLI